MTGAKLPFMGPNVEPAAILDLLVSEKVTAANAVPTVGSTYSMNWKKIQDGAGLIIRYER
jgi:hypothetical protein